MPQIKSGMILLWSGAIGLIPGGYVICDGTHGTPDLRDRFILGAGATFPVDFSAGSFTHTHNFTGDGHYHELDVGVGLTGGTAIDNFTTVDAATGTTDPGNSVPPFYALAWIMKL